MSIHPLAVVSPHAELGTNVRIGPFCVVEAGVVLGDDCHLVAPRDREIGHSLGRDNLVLEGTVLGGMPQHVHMPEHPGTTVIGDGNVFRENCTVHRALDAGKRDARSATAACSWSRPRGPRLHGGRRRDPDQWRDAGRPRDGRLAKAYMGGPSAVHQYLPRSADWR